MASADSEFLERAAGYWRENQALEAGRLIFEHLPPDVRPMWAVRILKLVQDMASVNSKPISRSVFLALNREQWHKAHRAFSDLRRVTLQLQEKRNRSGLTKEEELLGWVVALAELVAKVTYNATNPEDEFDEDSGWWIAASLKAFVGYFQDAKFSNEAWSALAPPEIQPISDLVWGK